MPLVAGVVVSLVAALSEALPHETCEVEGLGRRLGLHLHEEVLSSGEVLWATSEGAEENDINLACRWG